MSIWLKLKKEYNVAPLTLWSWIVRNNLTPIEIVIDFCNCKDYAEEFKEMLMFLHKNNHFVECNWGISFNCFMTKFLQFVIRIDSGKCMEVFIQDLKFNPTKNNNVLICRASSLGRLNIVRMLLQHPRVDPSAWNNQAIGLASVNGHTEVVRELLQDERVDPSSGDNFAIRWASGNGHTEVVRLLLQDVRVFSKSTPGWVYELQERFRFIKNEIDAACLKGLEEQQGPVKRVKRKN